MYQILTHPELEDIQPQVAVSPQEPKPSLKYHSLPAVRIGSIAGLLELLEDRQEKDLYRLAQELQLEVDEILPIVEGAKFMELVELVEGDISLTTAGQHFINGNIDERKHIVRTQLLAHIRLVQQINRLLEAKSNQRIPEELVLDILESHFSPQEAERQLKTAIDWGRYAEIYGYDEPSGQIFLEQVVHEEKLTVNN